MPRHGSLFTHGWCRHLFAQHPPLLQANVTQPMVQNAPAELLNNVELATASELEVVTVWEEGRDENLIGVFFFFLLWLGVDLNLLIKRNLEKIWKVTVGIFKNLFLFLDKMISQGKVILNWIQLYDINWIHKESDVRIPIYCTVFPISYEFLTAFVTCCLSNTAPLMF